ncbi:bile acid:sodium symporter [Pseudactinotalea sp.]|uniref:bile acid:sodium symporter n=1 Tax=Pseudactinotalea sp. TaxID=1926260 RepID=UPI003B3A26F7
MTEHVPRWAQSAERWQVPLYLGAIGVGAAAGLVLPGGATAGLEIAIEPVLGLLLYATFLGVPFTRLRESLTDSRFLVTVLVLNFVVVPLVVAALLPLVPGEAAIRVGVLLVLLTPCIDYVIVFTRLAGGAADRLLAAAPLLMLAQMALLPVYFLLFLGPAATDDLDRGPFLRALLLLIVLPLGAAALTQVLAVRRRAARQINRAMTTAMVPLMMVTLAVVVGSQIHEVVGSASMILALIPIYAGWFVVMPAIGALAARMARLDAPRGRALILSGATRNSLVVLPLALALPPALGLAPAVVVTQTLVELVALVVLIRVLPRLARVRATA